MSFSRLVIVILRDYNINMYFILRYNQRLNSSRCNCEPNVLLYIYIYSNSGPQVDPLSLRGLEGLSLTRIRSPIHRLTNSKRQLILHHISISLLSLCVCACVRVFLFSLLLLFFY